MTNERNRRRGFTLTEMLVVLFIMAIVLALVVGVSRYIMGESAKSQTISVQKMVIGMLQTYHQSQEVWPPDGGGGDPSGKALLDALKAVPATARMLGDLPTDALKSTDPAIKDGFGRAMRYSRTGGAGAPVLISAGEDGSFDNAEDNIRSDRH